jgi:hypothetical protein
MYFGREGPMYATKECNISEDGHLHIHHLEHLISHINIVANRNEPMTYFIWAIYHSATFLNKVTHPFWRYKNYNINVSSPELVFLSKFLDQQRNLIRICEHYSLMYPSNKLTKSGHVGFVLDKVALGHIFSKYFSFPCQFSFQQLLNIH